MRRQHISQNPRQYPPQQHRLSKQFKTISKSKKQKQTNPYNYEPKKDIQSMKVQINQLKSKTMQNCNKENPLISNRVIQKMRVIEKLVSKFLQRKQKDKMNQLIKLIQKQENIRSQLEDRQRERSKTQIKELKNSLHFIKQRQEEVILSASHELISNQTLQQGSGHIRDTLVGVETSPTMKKISFGAFDKRNSNNEDGRLRQLQEQTMKKNDMLNRIFGIFEQYEEKGWVQRNRDKNMSFGELCYQIQTKIETANILTEEIKRNEEEMKEYKECRKKYNLLKKQYHELRKENQILYKEKKAIKQKNELLKSLNEEQKKKFDEEFMAEYKQKIELTQQLNSFKKYHEEEAQKNRCLMAQLKNRLEDVKDVTVWNIIMKNKEEKDEIAKDLKGYYQEQERLVQSIAAKCVILLEQSQQRGRKIEEKVLKLEAVEKQLREVENHRFRLLKEKEEQRKELEEMRSCKENQANSLRLMSNIYEMKRDEKVVNLQIQKQAEYAFQPKQKHEEAVQTELQVIQTKQTRQPKEMVVQTDVRQTVEEQAQIEQFKTVAYETYSQTQQATKECQECDVQTEQLNSPTFEQASAQANVTEDENAVQTEKKQNQIVSRTSCYKYESKMNKRHLGFRSRIFETSVAPVHKEQQSTQTDELQQNISYNFKQQPLEDVIEQEEDDDGSQILQMLKDAEDCLLIPEMELLHNSIAKYKEEIERLTVKISQHEREKEEENVFKFRL